MTVRPELLEPRWYAVYTCSRREKQVARQLAASGVEYFLPAYLSLRQWKDRRVEVTMPLFPGYVFAHIVLADRMQVLRVPGVVSIIGNHGGAVPLPDAEMDVIRRGAAAGVRLQPHPYLRVGRRVRVRRGPLAGAEGILLRKCKGFRVVLSLDLISRSLSAEVEEQDIEPVGRA